MEGSLKDRVDELRIAWCEVRLREKEKGLSWERKRAINVLDFSWLNISNLKYLRSTVGLALGVFSPPSTKEGKRKKERKKERERERERKRERERERERKREKKI